jgi:hypothetical protein
MAVRKNVPDEVVLGGRDMSWIVAFGLVRVWRKAIWSLRLRLHSGLRQRGRGLVGRGYSPTEVGPFRGLWLRWAWVGMTSEGIIRVARSLYPTQRHHSVDRINSL